MANIYYEFLNTIFSPLLGLPPYAFIFIFSALITFIITLFYKYLANQGRIRELKQQHKDLTGKVKEIQKTNPDEANKLLTEILKLTNEQQKLNIKPMLVTLLFVFLFSLYSHKL